MKILIASALNILACACAASTAAKARTKQFPFELVGRSPAGLGGPFAALGAVPINVVSLGVPEDAEMIEGPPVVDGDLQDLLNFGGAMGAAVLRPGDMALPMHRRFDGAGGKLGEPLDLPLDALHVKMQHVPAPLRIDDSNGKVHIYGTLPKNLTAKSLKVTVTGDDDRDVLVKYFLGQDGDSKSVVGIDEHFALDFTPVDTPAVKYKASTGAFDLMLTRPAVNPLNKQVDIEFDNAPATEVKPNNLRKANTASASTQKIIDQLKKASQRYFDQAAGEVALKHAQTSEAVQGSSLKAVAQAHAKDLARVIKDLNKASRPSQTYKDYKDREARAQDMADRAKHFVSDVHLSDAKEDLSDAFAPLDAGLVMLEMNHRVRAH